MKRWAIIAAVSLLGLTGCSALRLVYTQAHELAYWWLDGYVDFNDSQTAHTREALDRWFAWHRRTQLPDYATLLARAANDVTQDITAAQSCRWFEELKTRADTAVDQALPDTAAIAATFTNEQIAHLQRKQAKSSVEFRDDFLQPDPAARLSKSVERAVDRTEQLYGRLNEAQRQRVAQQVAASPFDPQQWQAERERRQRELVQTLTRLQASAPSPLKGEAAVAALRLQWQHTLRSPDAGYAAYQKQLEAYNCEFFADIHNRTTPEQRREAQRRLRGWESDFRRLTGP